MERFGICLIITLLLSLQWVGDYELASNPAGDNIYRPDYEDGPIIGPQPQDIEFGNKKIRFSECEIWYEYNDPMFDDIIDIYNDVIFGRGYKERCKKELSDNAYSEFPKCKNTKRKISISVLIEFNKLSRDYIPEGFNQDYEAYKLDLGEDGTISIAADYYPGVVRALDTFSQLVTVNEMREEMLEIKYLPISIKDKPDFAYRGIMLDTAREFYFPDVIKMVLDGMMLGRNNIFHWHFAEDDSIPMYSESYPDLVDYTAFSEREIYTPKDVREIVKYAKIRGIKVVPEMEGPAHLHILGFYPEFEGLVGCFRNFTNTSSYHGGPPYAPVNPANEKTYEFLSRYLSDLSKAFDSDYWHLGGDEVSIGWVSGLPGTDQFLRQHNISANDLQNYYIAREREILRKINPKIKAGYWYRGEGNTYGDGDILQYWGGSYGLKSQMQRYPNNYFVLSPSDKYYLDCGYNNQYAGGSWCGNIHSWKEIWSLDPYSIVDQSNKDKFLGGEVWMWSEMNNEYNLPLKLFPRSAAMSFRLWNPRAPKNQAEIVENLIKHQYRLKKYGVPCSRVTQRYCEKHTHHCFGR